MSEPNLVNKTSTVQMAASDRNTILHHAERTYPLECCGILLGRRQADRIQIAVAIETENAWDRLGIDSMVGELEKTSEERRYAIDPVDLLAATRRARADDMEVVGIYHSHPNAPAVPSPFDLAVGWVDYLYAIVSVERGQAKALRCWQLLEGADGKCDRSIELSVMVT